MFVKWEPRSKDNHRPAHRARTIAAWFDRTECLTRCLYFLLLLAPGALAIAGLPGDSRGLARCSFARHSPWQLL